MNVFNHSFGAAAPLLRQHNSINLHGCRIVRRRLGTIWLRFLSSRLPSHVSLRRPFLSPRLWSSVGGGPEQQLEPVCVWPYHSIPSAHHLIMNSLPRFRSTVLYRKEGKKKCLKIDKLTTFEGIHLLPPKMTFRQAWALSK